MDVGRRSGVLLLGSDAAVITAFRKVVAGIRSRRRIDSLQDQREILAAALDQALRTPQGIHYLASRPTLRPLLAGLREK